MRIIPWFIGILALSAVMAQLPVQESPVTAQAPVAQGSNNCSPGCYRCYSYSVCYECYSGYYLSNAKCYRQSGSNSSGGVSWLLIICCILCCGGCCFGAARYAETHGHELHDHRETDYHHHSPCPHENDHRREMQDMNDPYGNPMMAGANLHGYNPPAHHMHGQPYVPPPPIQGMPAPYGYGPSVGFDSHNHPISSGYTPPPMTNYTYGAPADGLHINQQPQRGFSHFKIQVAPCLQDFWEAPHHTRTLLSQAPETVNCLPIIKVSAILHKSIKKVQETLIALRHSMKAS